MNETGNGTKSTVKENVSNLKDTASTIKDNVSTLVDQGGAAVDALKAKVGDVTSQVHKTGAAALDRTTSYVEENPFKSLAMAFGLGYLAMRIRTSPLIKLALLGGLTYVGARVAKK